jgi:hypothetical protein
VTDSRLSRACIDVNGYLRDLPRIDTLMDTGISHGLSGDGVWGDFRSHGGWRTTLAVVHVSPPPLCIQASYLCPFVRSPAEILVRCETVYRDQPSSCI